MGTMETQISTPQSAHLASAGHQETRPWRAFINQWIVDAEIRRDALKALIAVLATVVLVAGIVFPGAAVALGHLLALVLFTTVGKIITGSTVILSVGSGLWRRYRQR
ncbi:MAG TPA: hypothetical protein VGR06_42790 [Actinophytocola sp.]|uniref:hypothetical protein n=1 Tax=Actinophytocola sp. TaxID=1872138 RepID=UPI002DFED3B2|nr:hypothetical protein [Actinophytocola sp.]